MTMRKRLAALEARSGNDCLSLAVRAWLGDDLTPAEREMAAREGEPAEALDWSSMSKEDREWLQARTGNVG